MDPLSALVLGGAYFLSKYLQNRQSTNRSLQPPSLAANERVIAGTTVVIVKKQIVFVGKTSSGKSTLANVLFGCNFETGPGHRTTKKIQTYTYNGWKIIDTPGILDEESKNHYREIIDTVRWSELAVFVAEGQLYREEYDIFKDVYNASNKMVLFVNMQDKRCREFTTAEREIQKQRIREQAARYCGDKIFYGSASPIINGSRGNADIGALREYIHKFMNNNK